MKGRGLSGTARNLVWVVGTALVVAALTMAVSGAVSRVLKGREAPGLCSPINHCRVEKTKWSDRGWKSVYVKEHDFGPFCDEDQPFLQLEPELGIQLWLFKNSSEPKVPMEFKPHVLVNLYTYKLTHIIASATVPSDATSVAFVHRMSSDSPFFVEVSCYKR